MPERLGNFISFSVYNKKLKSVHSTKSPHCVAFVDADLGTEERKGMSYKNTREVQSIVHLVRKYYSGKNYCIITPYDGQRGLLQDELKREGLRWDNVFNVDSFQGNEADYILISIVRTEKPGFLTSEQRVNVMLTRCKEGMVIVSGRAFLHKPNVKKTLLGRLCNYWEEQHGGKDATWRGWRDVAEGRASLPGGDSPAGGTKATKAKAPQIAVLGRSLLEKGMREHPSSSGRHQAPSCSGTSSTTRAPLLTSTPSDSVPKARQVPLPLVNAARTLSGGSLINTKKESPSHHPSTSVKQGRKGQSIPSSAKARQKPSLKVDSVDELHKLPVQNLNLNATAKQAKQKQKASKKSKK